MRPSHAHRSFPLLGLNIGAHKEAAEHFLSALTLRNPDSAVPGGPPIMEPLKNADQIWQTLRRTFANMVGAPILV